MHALIIEDHAIIGMMIEDELRELGYTSFDFAAEQAMAVDLAMIRPPDLITADEGLSRGSGIEAVRLICAKRPIPVVFVTGNPLPPGMSGAVSVRKPFRASEFREVVRAASAAAETYA